MHPFVALIRRYVVDYTNRHDVRVCDDLMVPEYALRMGIHEVLGRDDAYKPAAQRQFDQFPGLVLTVNEVVTDGERLAMRFTEHGGSVRHGGRTAAWRGIGVYEWDADRLVRNYVEQDYLARRRQLASGLADGIDPPAVDPWGTAPEPADVAAEEVVTAWLDAGFPDRPEGVSLDDGTVAAGEPWPVDPSEVSVDILFSAGERVAFHGRHRDGADGAVLAFSGIVLVDRGAVVGGTIVSDRLGLERQRVPPAPVDQV